jgi:hypothetical protein
MILYQNFMRSKYLSADKRGHMAIFVATYLGDLPQKRPQTG